MASVGLAISVALAKISIAKIVLNVAISFVMSALTSALSSKPKRKLQDRHEMIRSAVEPRRVIYGKIRASGVLVYATSSGSGNKYLHLLIALAGHQCEDIEKIWVDEDELDLDEDFNVVDGTLKNYIWLYPHLGADDQEADAELVSASSEWTANHRLRGITYLHAKLKYSSKKYPVGIPVLRCLIKGKNLIYDPRTDTYGWTDNWALCEADYLTADIGVGADYSEINEDDLIAAANISDETVTTRFGTETRYTCNGTIEADIPREDGINLLATAGMGTVVYAGGQFRIFAGAATPATLTITEDDLVGPVRISPRVSRDTLFNTVRGEFANEDDLYQSVTAPLVSNVTYVAEDNDEEIIKDIEFGFTVQSSAVQRLGGISLARMRQQISVDLLCNIRMLRVQAWDTVNLTLEDYGWTAKKFRIHSWQMNEDATISLELREEADSDWNWDYANDEQIQDPSPDTSFDSPFQHGQVTGVIVESGSSLITIAADGTLVSNMKVSWTPPDYSEKVTVGWKKSDETAYHYSSPPSGANSVTFGPVIDGQVYNLEITSYNGIGVPSDPPYYVNELVSGKDTKPGGAQEFLFKMQPDGTREFNVVHPIPDADVRVGGGYNIRYQNGTSIDLETAAYLNNGLITTWPHETNQLAAGVYTFALEVVDSTGHISDDILYITATLGNPRLRNSVAYRMEKELGWNGTLTDCFVNYEKSIEAKGSQTYNDLPNTYDELNDTWYSIVLSKNPIKYETPVMNLGVDISFNPLITVDGIGSHTIKMRSHTSAEGSDLSAEPYVTLDQAVKRYVQFEITMTGDTPVIDNITTILDGEVLVDDIQDIITSSASNGLYERIGTGHFKIGTTKDISVVTSAYITAYQDNDPGWSAILINRNTTLSGGALASEFKIFQDNVLSDCTVDVVIKGPKEAA